MTDRISSDALQARRSAGSPVAALTQQAEPNKQVTRSKEQSLIKQSIILSDGENWTLVPKGAVLHIPESLANRINVRPVGTLLSWQDFMTRNRNWIAGEEVSMRQAEGVQPIDARRIAYWPKQSKAIVAVHLGGPISVTIPEPANETAQIR
jgi:hypothetical protein